MNSHFKVLFGRRGITEANAFRYKAGIMTQAMRNVTFRNLGDGLVELRRKFGADFRELELQAAETAAMGRHDGPTEFSFLG